MSGSKSPIGEKAAAVLGALMLIGAVGYLAWTGFRQADGIPDPRFRVLGIEKVHAGFLVRLEIDNAGGATAQGLKVAGRLDCGGTESETSEVDMQFLPSSSSIRGGLYFTRDPARCTLSIRPEGYAQP